VALVLGCAMSLMTSGRLTLRLVAPAAVYWSFIPLLEIAGLAAVCGKGLRAKTIDSFFAGHGPWLFCAVLFAAVWTFVPAAQVFEKTGDPTIWLAMALAAIVWSGWLDFAFSRRVLGRSRAGAARDLVVQRAIVWTGALAIFAGPAAVQVVAARVGL
jgi:hypothetical protein